MNFDKITSSHPKLIKAKFLIGLQTLEFLDKGAVSPLFFLGLNKRANLASARENWLPRGDATRGGKRKSKVVPSHDANKNFATSDNYSLSKVVNEILGSLSNDDGSGNENVTRKYIFISFVLLRDYFNSLNFYKNGELPRNQIGRSDVQVKKENEKFTVVRSRSPQNLKCGHFTLLFCRGRQRNVPKCKTHLQSDCFCSSSNCFAALSLPSSLLKLPIVYEQNDKKRN